MKINAQTPAIIVGMEGNGLGVARSLAQYQIPCIGIDKVSTKNPAFKTRYCDIKTVARWDKNTVIEGIKTVAKNYPTKPPVIITKDEAVLWISDARDELKVFCEINIPPDDVVDLLMNKQKFLNKSGKKNWPTPLSWFVENRDQLISCIDQIVFPCILKPSTKNSAFRQNSPRKAFKIANTDQLLSTYNMVTQWEQEAIIQEWIKGGDDRIAYCLTYYDRANNPVCFFAGRKLRQWPIECGNTAIAAPAPASWVKPLVETTMAIFATVGFTGLGSVEYKMRPESDLPVIMEPTVGRTNYQSEIAVINGVNIPAAAYFDLLKMNQPKQRPTTQPVKLIDSRNEKKAAKQYYAAGTLTLLQWIEGRRGKKKYMTFRLNDPGPFLRTMRNTMSSWVVTFIRSVLGEKVKDHIKNMLKSTRG